MIHEMNYFSSVLVQYTLELYVPFNIENEKNVEVDRLCVCVFVSQSNKSVET